MAAQYAVIGGGRSASACNTTIAATIGSRGGASPVTIPAAVGTLMSDAVFIVKAACCDIVEQVTSPHLLHGTCAANMTAVSCWGTDAAESGPSDEPISRR